MLQEKGLVIALRGENAVVQTKSKLACSSCKVSTSCGNGIVENYLSAKLFESEMPNLLRAKVGQQVVIEIPKSSVTKAAIIVYLIPLLFMLIGMSVSHINNFAEQTIIFISLLSLIIGLVVTKYYNRRWLKSELYSPRIVSFTD